MANILAKHTATITQVHDNGTIETVIQTSEACGSCSAKRICGNDQQKIFTLVNDNPQRQVGEQVTLVITRSMGFLAIVLAYLIPVVIILVALLIFQKNGTNEIVAGLTTLGFIGIYFIVLRLFKKHIENQITITIE